MWCDKGRWVVRRKRGPLKDVRLSRGGDLVKDNGSRKEGDPVSQRA